MFSFMCSLCRIDMWQDFVVQGRSLSKLRRIQNRSGNPLRLNPLSHTRKIGCAHFSSQPVYGLISRGNIKANWPELFEQSCTCIFQKAIFWSIVKRALTFFRRIQCFCKMDLIIHFISYVKLFCRVNPFFIHFISKTIKSVPELICMIQLKII